MREDLCMGNKPRVMNQRMQNIRVLVGTMKGLRVFHDLISITESTDLMTLVDRSFARLAPAYVQGHFDNVMVGDYREMMVSSWTAESLPHRIFQRLQREAGLPMNSKWVNIHVLDLKDRNSGINHHIDHECTGNIILGVNLLSRAILKFKRKQEEIEILLHPNSAYIMMDEARYEWSHSIPAGKEHRYKGEDIPRSRRVSLLLRNEKS